MAEDKKIEVSESMLKELMAKQLKLEQELAATTAALLVKDVEEGRKDIRELESLEEKYKNKRIRLRKVTLLNDKGEDKGGIVIGWSKRGSYEVWDKSGPNIVAVNMMDVEFLNNPGKLVTIKASQLSGGEQIWCDEVKRDVIKKKHKTGEEIEVTEFDTVHGRLPTGVIIDGYYETHEGTITLKVPGHDEPVTIDTMFANA